MTLYDVRCKATLFTRVDAKDEGQAKEFAADEFIGYLDFLNKAADDTCVSSPVEDLQVELAEIDD